MEKRVYTVNGWNNFCRVFELPEDFSSEYCIGGGIPTIFKMVDWFNPLCELGRPVVTKEIWIEKVGAIENIEISSDELYFRLKDFLINKRYIKDNKTYILITDFGASFTYQKPFIPLAQKEIFK